MEVRVRLLLRGGHGWEFCCKDDDPIVFGLVSALPGADVGGNLPPDGLVQIETRTGERLFLTRSSLVSVEIVPVADPLKFVGTKRLAAPSDSFPPGASVPSPFVLANNAYRTTFTPALSRRCSVRTLQQSRHGVECANSTLVRLRNPS